MAGSGGFLHHGGNLEAQHRSISQEVVHLLSQALDEAPPLSILALEGLGKARWREVDPVAHVARERRAWD